MPESVECGESERERGEKVAGEVDALDPGREADGDGGRGDGGRDGYGGDDCDGD